MIIKTTPVAPSIPFDNSTNGFTATDVQAAIEEAKATSGGTPTIPELNSDPVSPVAEQTWVLKTTIHAGGTPIGLLLALTYSGTYSYNLSYRTHEGTTVRVPLT